MKPQSILSAALLLGAMAEGQRIVVGCYKSSNGLTLNTTYDWNSYGECVKLCPTSAVFGLSYKKCFCGNEIPPDSDKVDEAECSLGCPGYDKEPCGTTKLLLIYDNGLVTDIPKAKSTASTSLDSANPSSTAASKSSNKPSTETVIVTPSSDPSEGSKSSKPNTAGIAAGVVVGVLAIAGIGGGVFLVMRNRKRRAIEEEHRRNAAVSSFIGNGKPSSSGGASSFTDTRLDPVMAQRRMSDGSIADNQDYSRRILKVTNA